MQQLTQHGCSQMEVLVLGLQQSMRTSHPFADAPNYL